MAVTQQRSGVATGAYPFYVADYALDVPNLPTPRDSDATAFVLETKQTLIWRNGQWIVYDDRQATMLAALRQAAESSSARFNLLMLQELRRIALLLAHAQGIPTSAFEPLPEL